MGWAGRVARLRSVEEAVLVSSIDGSYGHARYLFKKRDREVAAGLQARGLLWKNRWGWWRLTLLGKAALDRWQRGG